jgi:hypothetical protein
MESSESRNSYESDEDELIPVKWPSMDNSKVKEVIVFSNFEENYDS